MIAPRSGPPDTLDIFLVAGRNPAIGSVPR